MRPLPRMTLLALACFIAVLSMAHADDGVSSDKILLG